MKVIFYSEQCDYCKKLLQYLDKYNIKSLFKLINIDKTQAPKEIDIVPTIIDTELNQPLKGKKAFEYLLHVKYFNNPTNNIDYIKDLPSNPIIQEDNKALHNNTCNLEITNIPLEEIVETITPPKNNISNKKLSTLLKLKKK